MCRDIRKFTEMVVMLTAACGMSYAALPSAQADATAYLVNVTVRPGYNFAGPADALAYGQGICDKVDAGRGYAQLIADVKTYFDNRDEYQAAYLINQAVNELCPAAIWQLRNTAAHYHPPGP
ncbi:DUF732 domain-containing protein [Mycobacterium sp. NPDC051198]